MLHPWSSNKDGTLMKAKVNTLFALSLLAFAPAVFAQYTLTLTGVGDGAVSNGVFVSPYVGTIQQGTSSGPTTYTGYMICDDFTTESYLNTSWAATETASGALNGTEKFTGSVMFQGTNYTAQQAYNAASWLAIQLVLPGNVTNAAAQTNLSFAIWNIFDSGNASSSAAVAALEQTAFTTYDNTVQSSVSVYTPSSSNPNGKNQSQEFLVVNPNAAPEIDPTSAASALTLLLGGLVVFRGRKLRA
jgi:hypothetical protein